MSDHGDQCREHAAAFHNRYLWSELLAVPWILRGPGVPRGEVVTRRFTAGHFPSISPCRLWERCS